MIMQPRSQGEPEAPPQVTVDYVPPTGRHTPRTYRPCDDDDIGQVQGLIADPSGHQVTHVLLQKGHM